jgi:GH35 family endo-1,4-beta-xylanase
VGKKKRKNKKYLIPKIIIVCFLFILSIISYWYFSVSAPNLPKPPLKSLASKNGISLGVHAELIRLGEKPYSDILTSQFSFLTIDGESDWSITYPSPTLYNFTKVDKLVSFAKAHNMPIQLHHLVWGEPVFLPSWLKNGHYTSTQLVIYRLWLVVIRARLQSGQLLMKPSLEPNIFMV